MAGTKSEILRAISNNSQFCAQFPGRLSQQQLCSWGVGLDG